MIKKKKKAAVKPPVVAKKGLKVSRLRKALESKFSSDNYWTPEAGMNKIRLLPMPHDPEVFWVEVQEAYVPKPEGKSKQRFVSPKSIDADAYCPLTEASKALFRTGQKELSNELRTSSKYFCNAMVLSKDEKWVYKPIKLAYMVWRDLVEHCIEEADELGVAEDGLLEASSLLDAKKGRVVNIRRRENNGRIEYKTVVSETVLPIEKGWLDSCQDFSTETISSPVAEIEAALCEYLDVDDISEITGSSAGKPTKAKKKAPKRAPVEDDDDDEEDDDTSSDDEGDDEDEEADDDDEDDDDGDLETDDDEEDEEDDEDDESGDGEEVDEDESDDEEEDDEDEDPAPPTKRRVAAKKRGKK